MARLYLSMMLTIAVLAGPLSGILSAPARAAAPVLVIVPPWRNAAHIIETAQGQFVGPSRAPLAVLTAGDGADYPARLRRAGAWATLDGAKLSWICGA